MTNTKIQFHVSSRALEENLAQIRRNGFTPGNIFGLSKDSAGISLNTKSFLQHLKTEGESGLLYLVADQTKTEIPVLISEVQRHPVTNDIAHVSFLRVNLNEKITKAIDVKLEGLFEVKEATVLLVRDSIEVEALPADLPEAFFIDISKLTEVGQEVHIADLEYDRSKVTIQMTPEEQEMAIAFVQEVKEEVIEEPLVEEVPAEGAEATDAAAQPAEGGEAAKSEEKSE